MIQLIFLILYGLNLKQLLLLVVLVAVAWPLLLGRLISCQHTSKITIQNRRWFCSVFLIVEVVAIYCLTIGFRQPTLLEIDLTPFRIFHSYEKWGIVQTYLLNLLLFEPFGILLPNVLSDKFEISMPTVLFSVCIGIICSIAVEFVQYHFCLGFVEVDDVIFNSLGMIIGVGSAARVKKKEGNKANGNLIIG